MAWHEARKNCQEIGATLATVSNSIENNLLGDLIKANIWLGLNDQAEAGE